ncbi:MAG: DciA family protein [Pseudomonadota bacterium]
MALQRPTLPASLLRQAMEHQMLQQAICASLSPDLASHVTLINLRGGTLILGCDQQGLITTLRFCAPQILAAVNGLLPEPSALRVAWRALPPPATTQPHAARLRPSEASMQALHMGASATQDAELRLALQKLAKSVQKVSSAR